MLHAHLRSLDVLELDVDGFVTGAILRDAPVCVEPLLDRAHVRTLYIDAHEVTGFDLDPLRDAQGLVEVIAFHHVERVVIWAPTPALQTLAAILPPHAPVTVCQRRPWSL